MTIDHKQAINRTQEAHRGEPRPMSLPPRDVRRKRPPLASVVLRRATVRTIARSTVLLGLDFVAVCGALFTATAIKLAFERGFSWSAAWGTTDHFLAFCFLDRLFCIFRRYSGCYR